MEKNELKLVRGRWPGTCFVCSQGHPHGLNLRFYHTVDGVVCWCTVPDTYCGFDRMVHGGIITALMDEAAAIADERMTDGEEIYHGQTSVGKINKVALREKYL